MTRPHPQDLFGLPIPERLKQGELYLPGADAIERQPVRIASELPMDPGTVDLFGCPRCNGDMIQGTTYPSEYACPTCGESWAGTFHLTRR